MAAHMAVVAARVEVLSVEHGYRRKRAQEHLAAGKAPASSEPASAAARSSRRDELETKRGQRELPPRPIRRSGGSIGGGGGVFSASGRGGSHDILRSEGSQ